MVCVCVEVSPPAHTTRSAHPLTQRILAYICSRNSTYCTSRKGTHTHTHTPPPRALLPLQTNSHSTQQAIVPWSIPWLSVQEQRGRDVLRDEDDPPRLRFGIIRQ